MGRPVGRVGAVQDTLIPTCPDSGLAITLVGAEALLATEKTIHAHKVIKTIDTLQFFCKMDQKYYSVRYVYSVQYSRHLTEL